MTSIIRKAEIIRSLVNTGRANDVLAFLEGDSLYLSDASSGAPLERNLRRVWIMVVHHLRFIAEYGNVPSAQIEDGKVLSPYPDDFNRWLDAGAPGIADEDMIAYLEDNPLDDRLPIYPGM